MSLFVLPLQIEALEADSDFSKEQLTNMRARLDSVKETSVDSPPPPRISHLISQGKLADPGPKYSPIAPSLRIIDRPRKSQYYM